MNSLYTIKSASVLYIRSLLLTIILLRLSSEWSIFVDDEFYMMSCENALTRLPRPMYIPSTSAAGVRVTDATG